MPNNTTPATSRIHGVDRHVGERVRARRKVLKMSQAELAQRISLTFQQIQKYERGLNRISASKLFEISIILEVPIAWFFEGYREQAENNHPGTANFPVLSSAASIELESTFLSLPTELQRTRILELMKAMAR